MAVNKVMRNFFWQFFFSLLGIISILSQTVILRETTSLFYGNEIFYGLGLGLWLFFVGLGSLLAPKFNKLIKSHSCLLAIITTIIFLLPVIVVTLRLFVSNFLPFGELPALWLAVPILLATFLVFCFPLGLLFPLAIRCWQKKGEGKTVNQAYLRETIGLTAGGLIFSFFLYATSFPLSPTLNRQTLEWRYPNLQKVVNSKYNQIIVTKNISQENFFLNGQLVFSSKENYENEKFISLIQPFSPQNTEKILALTNPGLTSSLVNEFPASKVDFLEIDRQLWQLEEKFLPQEVNSHVADPRKFLKQTAQKWDLIIYAPGNPQTLLSNRYFTQESFLQARECLTENGVFVLSFYLPTDYQSEEATGFGNSIFQTFRNVFSFVELLTPEDQIILIGGKKEILPNKNKIPQKWHDYFFYQFNHSQRRQIANKLSVAKTKLNTDSEPTAFFHQQLFWQTIFDFKIAKLIPSLAGLIPFALLLTVLTGILIKKPKNNLALIMAGSTFVLISLETLIIFLFQAKVGYLYRQISLIFALVLAGMAVGVKTVSFAHTAWFNLRKNFLFYALLVLLFWLFLGRDISNSPFFWFTCTFVFGFFGGRVFAQTNNLYLKKGKHPGFIYAFDLFGGALGALLTSSLLLPTLGTQKLLFLLDGIILMNFLTTAKLR